MRFLVHHENSTYDPVTKRFYFNLDQRISNPTKVKVSKASYTASTTDSFPQVIYMRSEALNQLIKAKHTVDLVQNNHENPSDTIAVLEETHTQGRFRMQGAKLKFPVHSHTASSRKFDLLESSMSKLCGPAWLQIRWRGGMVWRIYPSSLGARCRPPGIHPSSHPP